MKNLTSGLAGLLIGSLFYSVTVSANLLISVAQIPPKTIFVLRQDINFIESHSFSLLNNFIEHEQFPEINKLYQFHDSDDPLSFFRYTNRMVQQLGLKYQGCLRTVKNKWSKAFSSGDISLTESNVDTGTLIIFDNSNGASIVTPNRCEYPHFSFAALTLKKSSEGNQHQLKSGDKLTVRSVRVKRIEFAYRISVIFDRHDSVKSLDIITTEKPADFMLSQLNFANDSAVSGKAFSIKMPKERYF